MNYKYTAYTKTGTKQSGVKEASSESEARALIQADGLFVDTISEQSSSSDSEPKRNLFAGSKLRQVAGFTRQMAVLITSGTPIVQALEAVERQTTDAKWKAVVTDLRDHVEEGRPLAEAMSHHPDAFDEVYRAMIAAGESGGNFESILDRLTKIVRQELSIKNNVTGAMVYPALLVSVASGVLVLLAFTVLPRFKELFETLNTPIPATTQMIMGGSELAKAYWWAILIVLGGAGFGLYSWLRTTRGRRAFDTFQVSVPVFGKVIRDFKTAKFARVLGVLMEARVPLLESLEIAQCSANNVLYEKLIASAQDRVERGESMSDAFSGSPLLPSSVCEAIRNGEQTGRVGEVLMSLADIMDEDNDIVIRSLTSIIEPLILTVLGIFVGFIAISLFLPLFDLTASTGAG